MDETRYSFCFSTGTWMDLANLGYLAGNINLAEIRHVQRGDITTTAKDVRTAPVLVKALSGPNVFTGCLNQA